MVDILWRCLLILLQPLLEKSVAEVWDRPKSGAAEEVVDALMRNELTCEQRTVLSEMQ